jgi:hypothetical protein
MSKILAVITYNKEQIAGGAPIFIAQSKEEQERIAFSLEKILDANAHDLKNGLMIIVDHGSD